MGAEVSREVLDLELVPQPTPVAGIHAMFCSPTSVTLHLREQFWSVWADDFTIQDAHTHAVWFRVRAATLTLRETKTLLDVNDAPVATIQEELVSLRPRFRVFAGRDTRAPPLFAIATKSSVLETFLRVEFTDVATGERCRMGLEGDWRNHRALIWLDRGLTGARAPVARIYRPLSQGGDLLFGARDYYLKVAPNVDVALVTLLCVVLDEKAND